MCSIDPTALIKGVYRENAATNDGWLLVIMQQPANTTPVIYGVPTQSMKIIHNPGYFIESARKSDWLRGDGNNRDGEMKREEASVYVITALLSC